MKLETCIGTNMKLDDFLPILQSCNMNFLVGSGVSSPFLKTLGDIEKILAELESTSFSDPDRKTVIKAVILKNYFDKCIAANISILNSEATDEIKDEVLNNYVDFIRSIHSLLVKRKSTLLRRQANLFTTNMDIFFETSLEKGGFEFNDGFQGTMNRIFRLSNFNKTIHKVSHQFGITSEIPTFNLFKLHGSVNWKIKNKDQIILDSQLVSIQNMLDFDFKKEDFPPVFSDKNNDIESIKEITKNIKFNIQHQEFLRLYEELVIVNPTKEKFKLTTLNYTYYEKLRIFSNELERENSVLFVMGFSFADEHIREIALRSLKANPTLLIVIFAYDDQSQKDISANLGIEKNEDQFPNLKFVLRNYFCEKDEFFTLKNINKKFFKNLLMLIEANKKKEK